VVRAAAVFTSGRRRSARRSSATAPRLVAAALPAGSAHDAEAEVRDIAVDLALCGRLAAGALRAGAADAAVAALRVRAHPLQHQRPPPRLSAGPRRRTGMQVLVSPVRADEPSLPGSGGVYPASSPVGRSPAPCMCTSVFLRAVVHLEVAGSARTSAASR